MPESQWELTDRSMSSPSIHRVELMESDQSIMQTGGELLRRLNRSNLDSDEEIQAMRL